MGSASIYEAVIVAIEATDSKTGLPLASSLVQMGHSRDNLEIKQKVLECLGEVAGLSWAACRFGGCIYWS